MTKTAKKTPQTAPQSTALKTQLTKALKNKISSHDIADSDMSDDMFSDMLDMHWRLVQKRTYGKPQISIYCPIGSDPKKRKTIIDIVSNDYAFLVDSIVAKINQNNFLIDLLLHPIVHIEIDKNGKLTDIDSKSSEKTLRQSHIHIHVKETLSDQDLKNLQNGLYDAIADVALANRDWKKMQVMLKQTSDDLAQAKTKDPLTEIQRYCAFLDYLYNHNFTLLGMREYRFEGAGKNRKAMSIKKNSLGLLCEERKPPYIDEKIESFPHHAHQLESDLPPVYVTKTNRLSSVHRRVPMDAISVKLYDDNGDVTGERVFLGLFTSVTYSRSVSDVPYLREKVAEVMDMSDFLAGSHDRKALRHILEKYPRDELFQISKEELYEICLNILRLQERQRIALFMRKDKFERYVSCLVYIPRDRFGTNLREQFGKILEEELNGKISNFYTSLDDSVFARVMFTINITPQEKVKFDAKKIEQKLQEAGQTWPERLSYELAQEFDDQKKISELTYRYGDAFPVSYVTRYRAKQALFDIEKVEEVIESDKLALDLYRPDEMSSNHLRLKVYSPDVPLTLSDVMPILENMGVRAISEWPFEITPSHCTHSVWIHDFLLEVPHHKEAIEIDEVKEVFEEAFIKIWYGDVESDGLNGLVITSGMTWRQITILRAYMRYMKQIRYPYSQEYMHSAAQSFPEISKLCAELFIALHDPYSKKKSNIQKIKEQLIEALTKVSSLDQDRILRELSEIIQATLRTNYFQKDEEGEIKSYVSFKIDSKKIPEMPEPRPYREIFVYSPRVEAIHLRGDEIARGGLRWSDRHEDFRSEVLDLMKAQMVKNAVIVPMGSKGGFVVKRTDFESREEFQKEGIECYKIFIRGLLDITDNLKGDKVIPPKDVMRLDGDDPYLVVAADKGTATFSDIANAESNTYDFWLGDAFASGGSAGYDHKKMGITARGAWESVKMHFRQLNHDVQKQPFDVIGVGDMGGDVFGNGMILSDQIRLVGAFNHLHIFCDPDPDPATTFKERKRLFKNVLGWDHYNKKLLSAGGRIYNRSDKVLELTPEIQKRFDLQKQKVSPLELIRAILKARTDLLWFGGIGTYIKASHQTDAAISDKNNDAIRIDANEVRATVIAEGANLGVSQLGRIEFAEKGGRINTDFLDNSGGVDCSDHEVNIKILMSEVMRPKSSKMTIKFRNTLLEKMTEDVAAMVLRNNYQQAQAISLAEMNAAKDLKLHEDFIEYLENNHGLSRRIEALPSNDVIDARLRTNKGMTRPELCILMSYAKINFTKDLLKTQLPDNPDMEYWLHGYFPDDLQKKYESQIKKHRLSREIIATSIANSMINRMGATFIQYLAKKTGASSEDIAKAYIVVRESYDLRNLWDSIEALDFKVQADIQLKAMNHIIELSERACIWFLTRLGRSLEMGKDIQNYKKGIDTIKANYKKIVTPAQLEKIKQKIERAKNDGLPEKLAEEIALLPLLSSASDIVRISLEQNTNLIRAASIYFDLGQHFQLDWLRNQAQFMSTEDVWQNEALSGLSDQLYNTQAALTLRALLDTKGSAGKFKTITERWLDMNAPKVKQLDSLFSELRRSGTLDLPMLIIAEQRLRNMV